MTSAIAVSIATPPDRLKIDGGRLVQDGPAGKVQRLRTSQRAVGATSASLWSKGAAWQL